MKDTDNKIPIYKINSKEQILEYYTNWTNDNQYNKDMIDWNYIAPSNAVKIFTNHTNNLSQKILDAGCGTGLVGIELNKHGFKNLYGADKIFDILEKIKTKE